MKCLAFSGNLAGGYCILKLFKPSQIQFVANLAVSLIIKNVSDELIFSKFIQRGTISKPWYNITNLTKNPESQS